MGQVKRATMLIDYTSFPIPKAVTDGKMQPDIATTRAEFIAFMGQALEFQGLSPISGRMLGLLIFEGGPISFSDLATELGVSRGSISANAHTLLTRGAIVKVKNPGDRQDYFRVAEEPFDVIMLSISERFRVSADQIDRFAAQLPQPAGDAASAPLEGSPRLRLETLAGFYRILGDGIGWAAKRFRGEV